jgi:dTDP-4-dehydrorhamnose 3,5-epimerase
VQRLPSRLNGPILLQVTAYGDERGFFLESYRRSTLAELGVEQELIQHNHSRSRRGVVRGIHYQPGMGKLVRCVRGQIIDVVVDIRRGSPTFGQWEAFALSDENHRQVYCPDGFGHGFCVVSEVADVVYGCTAYWDASAEGGFRYDDPEVGIEWPAQLPLTASAKDAAAPVLSEIADSLPFRYGSTVARRHH